MPEERIPKLIMDWIPRERRKRGRPRKTWMEGVQAAMTTRNLEPDQWRNREEWRLVSERRRQLLKKTGQIDSNKTSLINVTFMITKLVFVELLDDSRFVDILPNKDSFSIRNALQSSDRHPDSYSGHKMLRAGGGGLLLYKMLL